jgi:hypothetical protein
MSASHRTTVGIDATGTIAELADIPKGEYARRLDPRADFWALNTRLFNGAVDPWL